MHRTDHSTGRQSRQRIIGRKATIWLALGTAIGLHLIILSLPISWQFPGQKGWPAQIVVQLTTIDPVHPQQQPVLPPDKSVPEPTFVPAPQTVEAGPVEAAIKSPESLLPPGQVRPHDLEHMDAVERSRLTSTILSRQFITEKSVADRIFGLPLEQRDPDEGRGFHFPHRQDMVSMLDQPLPNIPFEYSPGLIHFAYDPGLKGELQRFWDVITPEFGWTTKHGTEVKCIWVLVIGGCGWK